MSQDKPPHLPQSSPAARRFIGLDVHKYYLIATGVDSDLNQVYGPRRVELIDLEAWKRKTLTREDALVLEMTTNTWQVYDELLPQVHSVTVVHPPHVALIVRAQVMTDKIAAYQLARLHAKGLLTGIWIPPQAVRDLRALIAQRNKMTRLETQAKNRLHSTLHRYHLALPEASPFAAEQRNWWLSLPVSNLEKVRLLSDLDTLAFAQQQVAILEQSLAALAAKEPRLPVLAQLPGINWLTALTILAAVGDIARFPQAKNLVGYTGLGARVHDSGLMTRTGRITKTGRKDLRVAMIEAAHKAASTHPHWQAELARLEPRLGYNKAIVAIARKLLVAAWHVLSYQTLDKHAQPERLARKFIQLADKLGKANRPSGQTAAAFARLHLDRLGFARDLMLVPWGTKKRPVRLPPSSLPPSAD